MYRQHQKRLLGYALRRAPVETAKDAVADAFLAAWRRFDEVPEDALPWLIGTTRRTLANQRRSAERQTRLVDRLAHERPAQLEGGSGDPLVGRALRRLTADDREALALVAWDGLTPSQAARSLGCSPVALMLSRLSAANPVPDRRVAALVPEQWSEELLTRVLSDPVEAGRGPRRLRSRARLLLLAAMVAALLIVPAYAVGWNLIDGWLSGEPAPRSVVDDFGSYTPQLGFHPRPGEAVLVAEDDDVSLYATTNEEGSYCLVAGAPWKPPATLPDGGTCIPPATAAAPLIAGLVGASGETLLIAGRIDDRDARTIRFADPGGFDITRPIGSSGFFIAAVRSPEPACAKGDWAPTFSALAADGDELARATITLARGRLGVCVFASLRP